MKNKKQKDLTRCIKMIKKYCLEQNLKYDLTACEVLSIIENLEKE